MNTGIDTELFVKYYNDGSAQKALDRDLQFGRELGIRTLPAYLVQHGEKALVFQSFCYDDFVSMLYRITGGNIVPQEITPTLDAFRKLLKTHPRISPIEVRESLDFESIGAVREFIQPLIDSREISMEEVHHGWFIRRNYDENNI